MKCNNQRNLDISMAKVTIAPYIYLVNYIFYLLKVRFEVFPIRTVVFLFLKGIWATTLANEKKLNRAFKVGMHATYIPVG